MMYKCSYGYAAEPGYQVEPLQQGFRVGTVERSFDKPLVGLCPSNAQRAPASNRNQAQVWGLEDQYSAVAAIVWCVIGAALSVVSLSAWLVWYLWP
jgi:hypothetical protein